MRAYKPKNDVQRKSYHSDRFFVTPQLEKKSVSEDDVFNSDYLSLKDIVDILFELSDLETIYVKRGKKGEKIKDKINLTENPEIFIWGVVTYVIHAL